MYRTIIFEREILIKLSSKLIKEVEDRAPIYYAVLSIVENVLRHEQKTSFAVVHETLGLIIGEVVQADIVVFSVEYIIDKHNLYTFNQFPENVQRAN